MILGPGGDRHGISKNGNLRKPVDTKSLRDDTGSGTTTETGGASTSTCQDSGKNNTKIRLGKGLGSNSSMSLRRILGDCRRSCIAQQERQSQQDLQNNTKPNAKVYDPIQKTLKALDTLGFLYCTFERNGKNLGEMDDLYDKDCDDAGGCAEGERRSAIRGKKFTVGERNTTDLQKRTLLQRYT